MAPNTIPSNSISWTKLPPGTEPEVQVKKNAQGNYDAIATIRNAPGKQATEIVTVSVSDSSETRAKDIATDAVRKAATAAGSGSLSLPDYEPGLNSVVTQVAGVDASGTPTAQSVSQLGNAAFGRLDVVANNEVQGSSAENALLNGAVKLGDQTNESFATTSSSTASAQTTQKTDPLDPPGFSDNETGGIPYFGGSSPGSTLTPAKTTSKNNPLDRPGFSDNETGGLPNFDRPSSGSTSTPAQTTQGSDPLKPQGVTDNKKGGTWQIGG